MESGGIFSAISRDWRTRIGESHDYAIIRNDSVFRSGLQDRSVPESRYTEAGRLLDEVLAEYEGSSLEETLGGEECETYEGACFCIRSRETLDLGGRGREAIRPALLSDLTLVYGIGRKKERELKGRGYSTIPDLAGHRRYGRAARESLAVIMGEDVAAIEELVSRWLSPSHPAALLTAGLYHPGDLLFIDLETLGLFSRPIILFGLASVRSGEVQIEQYLLRDIGEEVPALSRVFDRLSDDPVLISYNGKAFDLPYLAGRSAFYGRPVSIRNPHYDLLHFVRRRWGPELPDCRLGTIERHLLHSAREEDLPGAMVPEFYEAFLTTGNPGPLLPIVKHNRQDLVSLARLFSLMKAGAS